MLLTGDDGARPLNAMRDRVKKINGAQNAPRPRRSKRPPDRCAPTVPNRLCALPNEPATFQNSLSWGEYDRRLPPRTTARSRKTIPRISFLSGCPVARGRANLDCGASTWDLGDDGFSLFIFFSRSHGDDGWYDEGASLYHVVEKSFQPSPDFRFQSFAIHGERLFYFVHHL